VRRLVTEAITAPQHGPPLAAHVVPGDRVVVAGTQKLRAGSKVKEEQAAK
jgi:hypothetical protein